MATIKLNGKKSEKDRFTVATFYNMTGCKKIDLVVIGKSKKLRAFRKANTKKINFVHFDTQNAWKNR